MAVPYYNYVIAIYEEREARKVQRKFIRDICDPFDTRDSEFQSLWRITEPMAMYVVEKLWADLETQSGEGLPAHLKVISTIDKGKYLLTYFLV